MGIRFIFVIQLLIFILHFTKAERKPKPFVQRDPGAKYGNPNFIRDRNKTEIVKPDIPAEIKQAHRKPFLTAWMDYCDPYHCNDYFKTACGLNRKSMKFKWFQSQCHIILNNMCSKYRGSLKYDLVDEKYCSLYVMYLRTGCPTECEDVLDPVCGISYADSGVVLFANKCSFDAANCKLKIPEYEEVTMDICNKYLNKEIESYQRVYNIELE